MDKVRDQKFSVLKGCFIYFVVSLHFVGQLGFCNSNGEYSSIFTEKLSQIIGFGVPFFMLIGGFFYSQKLEKINEFDINSFFSLIKKSVVSRILVPYYVLLLVYIIKLIMTDKYNWEILYAFFIVVAAPENGLYFLNIYIASLLFVLSFFFLIKKINVSSQTVLLIIPLVSLLFFLITPDLKKIVSEYSMILKLPLISFFCFGIYCNYLFSKYCNRDDAYKFKILLLWILSAVVLTTGIVAGRKLFGHFTVITSTPHSIFALLYSFIFFMITLTTMDLMPSLVSVLSKLGFRKAGDNSLFIFGLHPYIILLLAWMLNSYMHNLFKPGIDAISVMVVVYVIILTSSFFYDFFPKKIREIF